MDEHTQANRSLRYKLFRLPKWKRLKILLELDPNPPEIEDIPLGFWTSIFERAIKCQACRQKLFDAVPGAEQEDA